MLLELAKKRRTIYGLGKREILSNNEILKIIEEAVKHTPSAFNSQSARVVVLLEENHNKLWDLVLDTLRKIVPAEKFGATENKINSAFKSGIGTILFFEDQDVIISLQEKFKSYKDNFPTWSEQSSGMLQYVIWTALAERNVGASLQHYNPIIDAGVKKEWQIPQSWKLISQMPFGSIETPAGDKEFMPINERVKVFK